MPLETPALNPTGGVKAKPPVMLDYRKDPTRPGGGVFIAHDQGNTAEQLKDVPEGVVISAGDGDEDDDAAGSVDGEGEPEQQQLTEQQRVQHTQEQQRLQSSAPLVNMTPLSVGDGRGSQYSNVNPAMNLQAAQTAPSNVQVMNILDSSQSGSTITDLAMADTGFLEGIPGGMFDWGSSLFIQVYFKVKTNLGA